MPEKKNLFKNILNSSLLFFLFVGLYPVIFLVSKNWFVYETKQLLFLLVIPALTCLIGTLVLGLSLLFKQLLLNRLPLKINKLTIKWLVDFGIWRIVISLIGFYLLYTLLEASLVGSKTLTLFLVGVAIITLIIKKTGFYFANIFFLVLTLLATGEMAYSIKTKAINGNLLLDTLDKSKDAKIKFTKKPNIYLIQLESYQSPAAMKRIYNLDNHDFVDDLSNMGFFVSQNNFSNYNNTLNSIGAMFLQQHHLCKLDSGTQDAIGIRDLIGGRLYNPALYVLKNNGYKVIYLHSDGYNFMGSDYLDYFYPQNSIHDSLLIFQSKKIDQMRAMIFNLSIPERKNLETADADEFTNILWEKLSTAASESQPLFFYIKQFGANHSPPQGSYSWKNADEGWVDQYTQLVKDVNSKIKEMVSRIIETDQNGIIILYGDHGAWRYRNIWLGAKDGNDLNRQIYDRKRITGEDLAYDLFGTFMAVRNPGGNNKFLDKETHVNFFRMLFFELSGNKAILDDKVANCSYLKNGRWLYRLAQVRGETEDAL